MEGYANYVEQICGKYQIPYFLDATKEVLFHPFIEFVRAILEVLEQDFSYNALMRLLRTGYCNVEQEILHKYKCPERNHVQFQITPLSF
jgi:ATP-dependent helicase/nuclease subunit B